MRTALIARQTTSRTLFRAGFFSITIAVISMAVVVYQDFESHSLSVMNRSGLVLMNRPRLVNSWLMNNLSVVEE